MAIPCDTRELENKKFFENSKGEVTVRVGGQGTLLEGVQWDAVGATYPDALTEVYSFYSGGLAGTLEATITVIYSNASKTDLVSAVRT